MLRRFCFKGINPDDHSLLQLVSTWFLVQRESIANHSEHHLSSLYVFCDVMRTKQLLRTLLGITCPLVPQAFSQL